MSVSVKGELIKLLDISMIRRYGSPTPLLDPAVAKILVNKGFAIYLNKFEEVKKSVQIEQESTTLFPKEIIGD